MLDSRFSSSPSFLALSFACLLASWVLAACSTVRPEDKEFLAEPSMSFTSGGMAATHEDHVLDNREGSTGAGSTRGGGCGCN